MFFLQILRRFTPQNDRNTPFVILSGAKNLFSMQSYKFSFRHLLELTKMSYLCD